MVRHKLIIAVRLEMTRKLDQKASRTDATAPRNRRSVGVNFLDFSMPCSEPLPLLQKEKPVVWLDR